MMQLNLGIEQVVMAMVFAVVIWRLYEDEEV
jgi:hypothetical protein